MNAKTILLVEDNPDDAMLTSRALRKINLINELVVVNDGAEALDYLFGTGNYAQRDSRLLPAVVLLDLKLAKVSGLEVLRRVRRDKLTEKLPVIVLTSSNEEKDLIECYKEGVNSYVQKPVDLAQFAEAVRQLGCYWLMVNEPLPQVQGN